MNNKNTLLILTTIFIVALFTALVLSYKQTNKLKDVNVELEKINVKLEKTNSDLKKINDELNTRISSFFEQAEDSDRIEDYVRYLQIASVGVGNQHAEETLTKISKLLDADGFVQIKDSNGESYVTKVDVSSDVQYYRVNKALSVRNGVMGRRVGVLRINEIIEIVEIFPSGAAQWAEIRYQSN